ncbi:two-component sensor histidine kinase [Streptomyces roseirectus]|uniref:histidine kinase n=1 Tax=Streptomyces roseirectus TaxID=2768066 RepID=A0A7H0IEL4_9ACTN|nr:histidine kinase [Streptomyces roseirectus]QNP71230.1 two-component sensor histidine kinase [Streptomyces roseirectus]
MTETTQTTRTQHTDPQNAYGTSADGAHQPRSPEARAALDALRGLRKDLIDDAFAYRPLPRLGDDSPLLRRLKGRRREHAAWAWHGLVVAGGLIAMANAWTDARGGSLNLLCGLLVLAPVLLTLVRPAGAFWLSLASTSVVAVAGTSYRLWPWEASSFVSHLLVLTVVAVRTRPRTAAWMWLLTAAYGFVFETFFSWTHEGYGTDTGLMLVLSAFVLLAVTIWHTRRQAEREVTAQQTVTEHERSRRTLLEERTTIARELHDVVAHHMSVVAIQAEAAPYRVENTPPELAKAFETIRENAVAALTELRRVLGVVRAEDYEVPEAPQPTLADLDALLANVREAGLTVEKVTTGAVRELPQGVELSAYRIVQEALSNTLRHAPGARATVELGYVLGGLGVRVVNGPGTHPSLTKVQPGEGHGLAGMRERVVMLNGEMTTGATDDGGYEVAVFLPVAGRDSD